jgi:hypothetical protein
MQEGVSNLRETAMTRLTLTPARQALLEHLTEPAELCDAAGQPLGVYHPARNGGAKEATRSPFSREELQRRRQQRTGRSLADIQKDLGM